MLLKPNKRPSGQAVVLMVSRRDADVAQKALNSKWMGNRYVEVWAYGDDNKDEELLHQQPVKESQESASFNHPSPSPSPPVYPEEQENLNQPCHLLQLLKQNQQWKIFNDFNDSPRSSTPRLSPEEDEVQPEEEPILRERHFQGTVAPQDTSKDFGLSWKQMLMDDNSTLKVKNTFLTFDVAAGEGYDMGGIPIRRMVTQP